MSRTTIGAAPDTTSVPGAVLFARYAYPPNVLGYCGPDDHRALLEYAASGTSDPGLEALNRGFAGAWPYLELIAGAAGIDDALDPRVVEAYWIGSPLVDRVDGATMAHVLEDRFKQQAGTEWRRIAGAVFRGGRPHHSFHVFTVYPWAGLLGSEAHDQALHVLDRCRIRTGEVLRVEDGTAIVRSAPLRHEADRLRLADPVVEEVRVSTDGYRLAGAPIRPGDRVGLHWDWICDRLSTAQESRLTALTARHLALATGPL